MAVGALFPHVTWSLIASDVYILAGEQLHDLGQYILPELERALATGAGNLLRYAPVGPCLVVALFAFATQPWVCAERTERVSRNLNLGNNCNETLLGILYNLLDIFLCVVTAIRNAVKTLIVSCGRLLAQASYLGEQGVFLYFDAPSLVLGKVPVETVHLVQCKNVNDLFNSLDVPEVT